VPVVAAVILTMPEEWEIAVAVFAFAAISDALDGHIARARGCITTFGTMMDPVADKLLVGAALIALAAVDRVSLLVVAAIVARELIVSLMRLHAKRRELVIAASPLGKAKMACQVAMVIALMAAGPDPVAVQVLVYATVAVTLGSALDYFLAYRRRLRPAQRGPEPVAADWIAHDGSELAELGNATVPDGPYGDQGGAQDEGGSRRAQQRARRASRPRGEKGRGRQLQPPGLTLHGAREEGPAEQPG